MEIIFYFLIKNQDLEMDENHTVNLEKSRSRNKNYILYFD